MPPRASKKQPFVVNTSPIQGKGAFATSRIRKGQRIIEYIGERIGPEEENRRYDEDKMTRHHTFLFEVDDDVTIDAAVGGNDARFINHSCDPNCEAVNEDGHIWIFAIKNIQPGVELAYDYNFQIGKITKKMKKFYACNCGTKTCRGTILALPKKKKKKKSKKKKKKR